MDPDDAGVRIVIEQPLEAGDVGMERGGVGALRAIGGEGHVLRHCLHVQLDRHAVFCRDIGKRQ